MNWIPLSERSREGKKPFTFWFDIELKSELKKRASLLNTTTTDLLNRAVKFYLERGYLDGAEDGQVVSSSMIAQDIKAMAKFDDEITSLSSQLKGLQLQVNGLEGSFNEFQQKLREDPVPTKDELRVHVQNIVGTYFSSQLAPILQKINDALTKLEE